MIRNVEKTEMPKPGCKAMHLLNFSLALALFASNPGYSQDADKILPAVDRQPPLTSAAVVRELTTEQVGTRLPVKLRAVVTFVLDGRNCFLQEESAGIFAGNGIDLLPLEVGDIVLLEGVSGSGEYAPVVEPSKRQVIGHTNLPPARRVSFEDLMTGREDSQWVEVAGLVRAVHGDPPQQIMEIATGGGRLTAFVSGAVQTNLVDLVDSQVRLRGVCGTWFNRLRQLLSAPHDSKA